MKCVLLAFIFVSLPTMACDAIDLGPTLEDFLEFNFEVVKDTLVQEAFKEASNFLDLNKNRTDFDQTSAEKIIAHLKSIADNTTHINSDRSQAMVFMAGIHGRISDKHHDSSGIEQGKIAVNLLKEAITVDGTNKNAGNAYASTISSMTKQNYVIRKYMEKKMAIDLSDEAKRAVKVLESMKLTSHPGYLDLKKF